MRIAVPVFKAMMIATVFPSCDSDKSLQPEAQNTSLNRAAEPVTSKETPLSSIDLASIGMVDPTLHQEPSKNEWQGEVFNDQALAQLKDLGKIFQDSEPLTFEALEGIVKKDSLTAPLVPADLSTAFDDETFIIRRRSGKENTSNQQIPLTEAFAALLKPFETKGELRSNFKIFKVQLQEGQPECETFVQITGQDTNTGQTLTRKARWRCSWHWPDSSKPPLLQSIQISEFEETSSKRLFVDCSESVFKNVPSHQAQFLQGTEHWAGRIESRYGIGISGWHGMALGDANGDGLDDLYLCEPGGLPNRLFLANSDGTVRDASAESGSDFLLQTQAALFVDLDNDSDQDLVVATTLGVIFMENDGKGAFTVRGSKLVPEAPPVALAAADIDLDGDLDIYTACYSLRSINTSDSKNDAAQLGRPIPYHDANNGGRNVLFRNDRNWRFTDATTDLGLDQNNRRYSFAPTWEDYDDDGDPDLYVANDYGRNNLYRNDRDAEGNSHFTDVAGEAGVEDISAGMSASWGDADGDGDRDLYVSNMWSSAGNRIAYQRNFQTSLDDSTRGEFQRHARGNSLFLNNGDGTFTDASQEAGVTMGRWAWGSRFVDINNDSNQDLIVSNGFLTQSDSGDL
ncbi:MAG: VCBS repeat-containing protein [Akkermansiaceae bacterium]|jgi:hypothetical protein